MKNLLSAILLFISFSSYSQTVELTWKIGEKERLNYLTVMNDIDTSKVDINWSSLFKSSSDKSKSGLNEVKNIFEKLNESMKNIDFVSSLSNKGNGIIDIEMSTKPKEKSKETENGESKKKENEYDKFMQSMMQGVMLRGSVYSKGGIHSFWVKSNQKNLIAILFELPNKPVKIGDSWKIDTDLISNDQNFTCDSSFKINEVTLVDLKKVNDETIAVLKYNIVEYVNGSFTTPSMMGGGETKTMMKFEFQAISEFSIEKGRWISYDGIMSLDATGFMNSKKKTNFKLISEK